MTSPGGDARRTASGCRGTCRSALMLALGLGALACGGATGTGHAGKSAPPGGSRRDSPVPAAAQRSIATLDGGGADGAVVDAPARPAEPPPTVNDLASALRAARRGYDAVADAFLRDRTEPEALLARAELALNRGACGEAEAFASAARRSGAASARTEPLRANALLRCDRAGEAEKVLREAARVSNALVANTMLGRLLQSRGMRAEAEPFLRVAIEAYNGGKVADTDGRGLVAVAQSAWALGAIQDANNAFREAVHADSDNARLELAWAELFVDKHEYAEAERSLGRALELNPNLADAHAMLAGLRLEATMDIARASDSANRALEIDSTHADALWVLGRAALLAQDADAASGARDRFRAAHASDPRAPLFDALARYEASDAATYERAIAPMVRARPHDALPYHAAIEQAERLHRYADISRFAERAAEAAPSDANARAALGLNLLRLGESKRGLEALRAAWELDHYNARVFNLLELYEKHVEPFYEHVRSGPIDLLVHRDEAPVLAPYATALLRRAYDDMRSRYGVTPDGPLQVELWNSRDEFSVSATGLPRLGLEGVCFGKVIMAISPAGSPANWGEVLWHELSHVFHLKLSAHRVPRWFTEGLAEYETTSARPEWKREEDSALRDMVDGGRLPPVRDWDRAFLRPRSGADLSAMYFASSLFARMLVDRYGFPKVRSLLVAWGAGMSTEEAFRATFGAGMDELDRVFRESLVARWSAAAPDPWLDRDEADARPRNDAVATLFRRAHRAAREQDTRAADQSLSALVSSGVDGYRIRMALADVREAQGDLRGLRVELERAAELSPDAVDAWRRLWGLGKAIGDGALVRRAVFRVAEIDQHGAHAWVERVRFLADDGAWKEALEASESALYVAPYDVTLHRLRARALAGLGRRAEAAVEEARAKDLGGGRTP